MARAKFRLALLLEGRFWSAYLAPHETMEGAILLGSIHMAAVEGAAERKNRFMALMQDSLSAVFKNVTGGQMTWPEGPRPAPEHERSGSA